jgi:hypothetical protein
MFSLNRNGIFVLTMFKKSYFLKWGSPPQTSFTAVPLTSQHPKSSTLATSPEPLSSENYFGLVVVKDQ